MGVSYPRPPVPPPAAGRPSVVSSSRLPARIVAVRPLRFSSDIRRSSRAAVTAGSVRSGGGAGGGTSFGLGGEKIDVIGEKGVLFANAYNNNYEMAERSEEHTSELQSLMRISYAVFCLKKKKTQYMYEHKVIRITQTMKY